MEKKYVSIKNKLLRIILLTSGVVLFLTCSAFFAYEFFSFRQTTKEQLFTLGKIIAANSTAALAFESQADAVEILQALKAEKSIVAACLYDQDGKLFARYPVNLNEKDVPIYPTDNGYVYTSNHLEGFQPIILEEKRIGTLFLRSDLQAIYNRFKLYGVVALLVMIISIGVAYLLSRRLQRTVSNPILALAKTARTVSFEHDYTVRAQKSSHDELGELTDAFNQMLTQIEEQNAEITSFTQDLEKKVTERTNQLESANSELMLKNEFVETIIDSSVDVIAVFDRELNYVILNKYAQEQFGLRPQEVIGKNLLDLFPSTIDSSLYDDLKKCLQGLLVHNPNYQSHSSNRVLENYYIPLLDGAGEVYRILLIGHDITQSIEATEKLSALNSQLAMSNRDLEQFAYVASHDLQEPLRKIQTYASLIEQETGSEGAAAGYISKLIASVVRMRELIRSILNYSQVSNNSMKFEKVDLNAVIENIKIDYELSIAEKGAEIISENLPVVEGDQQQLSQLFLNLISNSLKFSQRKPQIRVCSSVVDGEEIRSEYQLNGSDRYAKITVQDNGIGFDQQFAEKVFVIFQRFHSKNQYPGTGIGLALCKKIVENHKGAIFVNSVQDQGTTFTMYLPA